MTHPTITVWAEHGTVATLPPEAVIGHHANGDLLRGDYLLIATRVALALYEAGQLSVLTFAMLRDDVQADVREHMRRQIEEKRRVRGDGVGT